MTTGPNVSIRPLQTWAEYIAAEEIQHDVWQMSDWRDTVPAHILITAQKNGGIVLGAFAETELVGLAFGFLGREGKTIKLCSDLLAVRPEWQRRQIGQQLKFHQREFARKHEIALITWTYDPLLARNAMLNIGRLGAIARRYLINVYGEMTDGLNAGLPSDRFEVEWWVDSPGVQQRIERLDTNTSSAQAAHSATQRNKDWDALLRSGAQQIIHIIYETPDLPNIDHVDTPSGDTVLIEIPSDLGATKAARPELARDWRYCTREVFQRAFAAGYAATDVIFATRDGIRHAAYVLTRQTSGSATGSRCAARLLIGMREV